MSIQLIYLIFFFVKRKNSNNNVVKASFSGVSVVVCAKNESENLSKNLPLILTQNIFFEEKTIDFEVIVINDCSDDNSAFILSEFTKRYPNLIVENILKDTPKKFLGKKNALSKALTIARFDNILLTDADCVPASNNWMLEMVMPLFQGKEIVAGYGAYNAQNNLLNKVVRWETLHSFMQWSSFAKIGLAYMAVGRNLACKKTALLKAQSAPIWNKLPSGDDDLLMNISATSTNVAIVECQDAFTYSPAKTTWNEWVFQKQRHLSTGKYYQSFSKFLLALYAFTHACCWLFFFAAFLTKISSFFIFLMLIRIIFFIYISVIYSQRLNEKLSWIYFPFLDLFWLFYNLIFSPYIFFKTQKKWSNNL